MSDVVVIGGGVIGLSLAYELAKHGALVTLLERGRLGREASCVGAGIITAGEDDAEHPPLRNLLVYSRRLLAEWSRALREETGIDSGLRWCGSVRIGIGTREADWLAAIAAGWPAAGIQAECLDDAALRELEPALTPAVTLAYHVPGEGQIDNIRHLAALTAGCTRLGVRVLEATPVTGFVRDGDRLRAVRTPGGPVPGDAVVIAAGAWTPDLVAPFGLALAGEPVRGQIVRLKLSAHPLRRIVWRGTRYLVPRLASPLLVGSTMERVGFDRRPTAEGVRGLLSFAEKTVPALAGAVFAGASAGLRPGSADGLPFLGRAGALENLYITAGHSRAGIELSAGSARLLADLILGRPPALSPDAFDPGRSAGPRSVTTQEVD